MKLVFVAAVAAFAAAGLGDVVYRSELQGTPAGRGQLAYDLNGDGVHDLLVANGFNDCGACCNGTATVNGVIAPSDAERFVRVLDRGDVIGDASSFADWGTLWLVCADGCISEDITGSWCVPRGLLFAGVRFESAEGTHYAWVRFANPNSLDDNFPPRADPIDAAYESSPDVPIAAGDGLCPGDCDGSGSLDVFDFLCFQAWFGSGDPRADCDHSGQLSVFDFLCFLTTFGEECE